MFRDAFTKLDALEVEDLIARLNPLLGGSPYDAQKVTILAMELPFYPGCRFLEIADHSVLPSRKSFVIYRQTEAVVLDWTNVPIYRLNETVPLALDERNIVEYVRFFFSFVRWPSRVALSLLKMSMISRGETNPPLQPERRLLV